MDYQGQALCEKLYQLILLLSAVFGFGYGYWLQSFWVTFLWCVGGFVFAALVCVPDWPFYRKHPMAWQPAQPVPGEMDINGQMVKDTNTSCGTCACGVPVHGIHCESHPDATAAEAAVATETAEVPEVTAAAAPPAQETKARSGKKGVKQ